jgi:hypothetical protein
MKREEERRREKRRYLGLSSHTSHHKNASTYHGPHAKSSEVNCAQYSLEGAAMPLISNLIRKKEGDDVSERSGRDVWSGARHA